MGKLFSKLAIGTANFGLDYGLNNVSGKVSDHELSSIIEFALQSGIKTIDTAQTYGDSEERLGRCSNLELQIITKIGVGLDKDYHKNAVSTSIETSLRNLNVDRLYAVLLHQPELLLGVNGIEILAELKFLKSQKMIEKIGVSIYSPEILHDIINVFEPDIVQAPFNVFDQRLYVSGWAERLKSMGAEIHIRSAFLQGLLLMKNHELPARFQMRWAAVFERWFAHQKEFGHSALEIALSFCLEQSWADKVVVGVDNVKQLQRLVDIETQSMSNISASFAVEDELLITPSNWNEI